MRDVRKQQGLARISFRMFNPGDECDEPYVDCAAWFDTPIDYSDPGNDRTYQSVMKHLVHEITKRLPTAYEHNKARVSSGDEL